MASHDTLQSTPLRGIAERDQVFHSLERVWALGISRDKDWLKLDEPEVSTRKQANTRQDDAPLDP